MKNERGQGYLKKVDLLVGGGLLFLWSLIRRKRGLPGKRATIGIFAFAAIGDSILSSVIISELRKTKGVEKIVIFASKSNIGIYELFDGHSETVVVPLTNPLQASKVVRKFDIDVLIDTSQWPRISALLAALTRTKFTVGFKTPGQFRHYAYDACVEHSDQVHEVDNFRNLLRPLGIRSNEFPRITRNDSRPELPSFATRKYVVFHPWAAGTNSILREWPTDRWHRLADALMENGYCVVISGGPADFARAEALKQRIGHDSVINIAAKFKLKELAEIVRRSACVVSVNTGVMHLSAMLDTPLISLHGPTNSFRWGPVNKEKGVLSVPKEQGGGYLNLGFEYPRNADYLLDKINVDSVLNLLRDEYSLID